jgi:hypothetical protein
MKISPGHDCQWVVFDERGGGIVFHDCFPLDDLPRKKS